LHSVYVYCDFDDFFIIDLLEPKIYPEIPLNIAAHNSPLKMPPIAKQPTIITTPITVKFWIKPLPERMSLIFSLFLDNIIKNSYQPTVSIKHIIAIKIIN